MTFDTFVENWRSDPAGGAQGAQIRLALTHEGGGVKIVVAQRLLHDHAVGREQDQLRQIVGGDGVGALGDLLGDEPLEGGVAVDELGAQHLVAEHGGVDQMQAHTGGGRVALNDILHQPVHGRVLFLVLRPVDQLVPLAVEIAVGDVEKDIRFIFIIVIERPLGHAGRRGNLGQRDVGKRLRVQQAGRGTNSILDRKAGAFMHSIASVKGNDMVSKTHSKGGGILHTVHDNLLIGPDAVETYEKENTATHPESIAHVFEKQKITMPALTERDIITYFTGVRAPTFEEDFIIERGRHTHNLIHVAGIQSPGLTTAPAVAEDVADMAVRILARERPVAVNPDFDPHRPGIPVLREMDDATRAEYIAKNPDYGVIVCRCEEISRGEILDALRSNVCVPTVDGVKKRVRPGMGRCQGGFCSPQVVRIIAEYLGVPLSAVRKSSADTPITFGPTKSGEVQA